MYEIKCKNIQTCMWDRHDFIGVGIQCPIFYKPKQIVRKKKEYYMNQNITRNSNIKNADNSMLQINKIIDEQIFYDDMFCSYECCLAWIDYQNQNQNPKYKNSKQILYNEFLKKNPNIPNIPNKANDWKIIDKFGGFLNLNEFRENKKTFVKTDCFYKDNSSVEIYKEIIDYVK